MEQPLETLVCFAVKEEAGYFKQLVQDQPQIRTLITGIGKRNAEREIRAALAKTKPTQVWSCGFAGGLAPEFKTGMVVFAGVAEPAIEAALVAAGARPAQFHCAERVAVTVLEKRALREATGADAVEMESQVVSSVCRDQGIPCVTLRVILDTVEEDLPLDFNALMAEGQRMDARKLAWRVARSPQTIPALIRLQKQSRAAAQRLGDVLAEVLRRSPV
jgi:nucleoside phosphorylase